jgi:hypothetical protein
MTGRTIMRAFLLSLLWLVAGPALAQEKLVGTNMDVRTILEFKVADAAIQKLLPPGFEANPATSGPSAGANLRVTFVDQMAAHDAAGKPTPPVRNLIFGIPVRKPGSESSGLMIFAGLSPAAGGPYGASLKATSVVERKVRHEAGGNSMIDESWEFKGDDGSSTTLQTQYLRGVATRGKGELRVYSQLKPEFFRIYRFEQGVDVVRGAGTGPERLQKVTFKAAGEKLSPLFDGTEQLISMTSVPWYQREIYLPGS